MSSARLFIIATALWTAQTSAAPQPLADVPMLHELVQISVAADIGSHTGVHCILDTESSVGVLHSDLTIGSQRVGLMNTRVANGKVAMPIVEVRRVAVATAEVSFVQFVQRDHSWFDATERIPCVIGASFMNHFTVDFDGANGRVRLYPRGTRIDDILGATPPAGTHLNAQIVGGGLIRVNTMVGSIQTLSEIDTGWAYATANAALLDALGFTPNDARIRTVTKTHEGKQANLKMSDIDQVRIGALLADKVRINLGETDMSHISTHREPYLQIGSDLIRQHRLLIDYARADVALIP